MSCADFVVDSSDAAVVIRFAGDSVPVSETIYHKRYRRGTRHMSERNGSRGNRLSSERTFGAAGAITNVL